MGEKRKRADVGKVTPPGSAARKRYLSAYLLAFSFGAVLAGGGVLLATQDWGTTDVSRLSTQSPRGRAAGIPGRRTVAELISLPDEELERADIVELSIAVAREVPGLQKLDYDRYSRTVHGWTEQFTRWVPTIEHKFHQDPSRYHNDIDFFRLGMLAQFPDQHVGIAYVEEQREAQIEARKAGRKAVVFYTDPGDVLLHGLIDTKRGTCVTMPTLHVAMGRRLAWLFWGEIGYTTPWQIQIKVDYSNMTEKWKLCVTDTGSMRDTGGGEDIECTCATEEQVKACIEAVAREWNKKQWKIGHDCQDFVKAAESGGFPGDGPFPKKGCCLGTCNN